ncbi:MAG: hypothetical protein JXR60_09920 [Bacteroidales bacterium]|nr:hypothetical protein [Bacteroidales bacterium]
MSKIHLFFLSLFLFLGTNIASAQFIGDEEPEYATKDTILNFADRLVFGGSFGLIFGTYSYVNISPVVGYRINNYLTAGVGGIYEYIKDRNFYYTYESTIFGGKVFANVLLFDYVILYAENNMLSLQRKYFDAINNYPSTGRFFLNVPWIGAGVNYGQNGRGAYMMILFNLNQSINSPYPPYEYRFGFYF